MNKRILKCFSLVILVFCALNSKSQETKIGAIGGVNWSSIDSDVYPDDVNSLFSFHTGLSFNHAFENGFQIGADAIYIQKGIAVNLVFSDNNGNIIALSQTLFAYNYFSIPLKAGYKVGGKFSVFANVGVVPSYLYKARLSYETPLPDGQKDMDFTNDVQKFDLGGMIEIGTGYQLSKKLSTHVRLGFSRSFTNSIINDTSRGGSSYHETLLLSAGIQYSL